MTNDSGCQVRDFLPAKFDRLDQVLRTELEKDSRAGALAWDLVTSQATEAVARSLDCDVFELLARGWCVARELHEYTDPVKHPRGERSIVHLGKHSFSANLHPVLTYRIGPLSLPPLRLTLELSANFNSVALSIDEGHITGIGAGDCHVGAQLKYRDVKLHKQLDSRHVALPGHLTFSAPGLPID